MPEKFSRQIEPDIGAEFEGAKRRFINVYDLVKSPESSPQILEYKPSEMIKVIRQGNEPLLVSIPHGGSLVPEKYADAVNWLNPKLKKMHDKREGAIGVCDHYTDTLYAIGERPYTSIYFGLARMFIDPNRNPEGGSGMGGGSPFWETVLDGTKNFRRELSEEEKAELIRTFHQPYHGTIETEMQRMEQEHGFVFLFDAHTMPTFVKEDHIITPEKDKGLSGRIKRKPFNVGTRDGDLAPKIVNDTFIETLRKLLSSDDFKSLGYAPDDVTVDEPFNGGGWTPLSHVLKKLTTPGEEKWMRQEGRYGLVLEIAKEVYMEDERNLVPDAERMALANQLVYGCLDKTLKAVKNL